MQNFELTSYSTPFIRVVIVDDHKAVADGFEHIINESENVRVTGKAYTAAGCLDLLKATPPDVLLLDIGLPDINGIDLCATIKETYPHLKVLMLTGYGELFTINRALNAGADGYMLKSSTLEEIIEGIQTVVADKQYLCDEVKSTIKTVERKQIELTRREMELLQLIGEGLSIAEISDRLCLGQNTLRTYRQQLYSTLDAHNTAQLIQIARKLKLI
jgi:DNA-binding NarL/FixJ family response regulator